MFRGHHRKVRAIFAILDVLIVAIAFELAYWTRVHLELTRTFFLTLPVQALLLGWSIVVWVALGYWWELYDRMDAAHPSVILRDAFRQCLTGAASVILLEFLSRLDLSRPFVALFA